MVRTPDPSRRALPFADWPSRDRSAFEAAIQAGDILDGQGPAAHPAAATRRTNVQHYGRFLGFLAWTGSLNVDPAPANRATPEAVHAYERHLAAIVAPCTRLSMLVGLKVTISVMAPDRDWHWLQVLCNRIQRGARPARDKRARMLDAGHIYRTAMNQLAALPAVITQPDEAIRYRDALMLALITARPVRASNFQAITLDRHLTKIGDRWLLAFAAKETKTRVPIEFWLPDDLVFWLERYLVEVRLLFPSADTTRQLWINQCGTKLGAGFAYSRLVRITEKLIGARINPHLFRDCAASSLACVSPQMARAATPLLGHRYTGTTERYYIQAESLDASRSLNAMLDAVRNEAPEA